MNKNQSRTFSPDAREKLKERFPELTDIKIDVFERLYFGTFLAMANKDQIPPPDAGKLGNELRAFLTKLNDLCLCFEDLSWYSKDLLEEKFRIKQEKPLAAWLQSAKARRQGGLGAGFTRLDPPTKKNPMEFCSDCSLSKLVSFLLEFKLDIETSTETSGLLRTGRGRRPSRLHCDTHAAIPVALMDSFLKGAMGRPPSRSELQCALSILSIPATEHYIKNVPKKSTSYRKHTG